MDVLQSRRDGHEAHRLGEEALPRVIVVGGGFGGLAAVRRLRNQAVRVSWIARDNYHLFQPLLYQVATGALSPADIAAPLRAIVRGCRNIDVILDEVVDIDAERRTVRTARQSFTYDYLVVATGAETSYFGNDGWARHANGLKTLEEAIAIRSKILLCLELAETSTSEDVRRPLLTFVLIGAGPTGVELAGAIADLAKHMLARDYSRIKAEEIAVVLLEGMDQVLPGLPKELASFAENKLKQMGVDVRVATKVDEIDDEGVVAGGERIPSKTVIWSAGVEATPVVAWLKAEADKKGRIKVGPDLSLPGRPDVFVIGDAAAALGADGRPLPGLAAVAKQQGTFVGRRILDLAGNRSRPATFRYRDWGTLATMGRSSAVADFGWLKLSGFVAWVVWAIVHIWYLIDFRNRIRVLINWMWLYLTLSPGARLITGGREASRSERPEALRTNVR